MEAVGILAALLMRRHRYWLPLLACNLLLLAAHPLLISRKLEVLVSLNSANGGYNVLGSPREPLAYLRSVFGLGTALLSVDTISHKWVWVGRGLAILAAGTALLGVATLARQRRFALPMLCWLALIVAGHVFPFLGHDRNNWYVAYKIVSQTYFVIILAAAALVLVPISRWRHVGRLLVLLWLLARATVRFDSYPRSAKRARSLSIRRCAMACARPPGQGPSPPLVRRAKPLWMLGLVSGETGVRVQLLTDWQQRVLPCSGVGKLAQPEPIAGAVRYEGLLVVEREQAHDGPVWVDPCTPLAFDCQQVLLGAGAVTLCRGRLSLPFELAFPGGHWVSLEDPSLPPIWTRSDRLRVAGEVPSWQACPYHFTCAVRRLDWSHEVVVDQHGPFCVTLDLPSTAAGRAST